MGVVDLFGLTYLKWYVYVYVCDFNLFEFIKESELIDPPLRNAYSLGPICNHPPLARDQINILIFK